MSWFEAWLIWRLNAISDVSVLFTIISFIFLCIGIGLWGVGSYDEDEDKIRVAKWFTFPSLAIFILLLSLSVATPSTTTFFKIIATKYGADALTSEKAGEIGEGVLESIEKAQKLLNQKLDVLIDEKQVKQEEK